MKAKTLKRGMQFWPPFFGAGIRVTEATEDFTHMSVLLKYRKLGRNMFGTQFGGSIFMMTDPFFAIMLSKQLGRAYRVWDTRAEIDFIRPGKTELYADFRVSPRLVAELKQQAEGGNRVLHWFECEVLDREGQLVARVRKELYVREKIKHSPLVKARSRRIARIKNKATKSARRALDSAKSKTRTTKQNSSERNTEATGATTSGSATTSSATTNKDKK